MNFLQCIGNRARSAFSLLELLITIAVIAICAALILPNAEKALAADQQGYATTYAAPTNMPATVATATITAGLNNFIPIRQGRGLGLEYQFNVSSGTSNVVVQLAPSVDGTNIDSTIWPWTVVAAGTATQTRTTNWSRGSLDGYAFMCVVGFTNQNAGTLTNKLMFFNVPNN